jgi:hypothetical protein
MEGVGCEGGWEAESEASKQTKEGWETEGKEDGWQSTVSIVDCATLPLLCDGMLCASSPLRR